MDSTDETETCDSPRWSRYAKSRCKCAGCRTAWRAQLWSPEFPHGTRTGYNYLCRCDPCYEANSISWQLRRSEVGRSMPELRFLAIKKRGGSTTCGICNQQFDDFESSFVDYDRACCDVDRAMESCGTCVRGLLCGECNTLRSFASDSPERLRAVARYLEAS